MADLKPHSFYFWKVLPHCWERERGKVLSFCHSDYVSASPCGARMELMILLCEQLQEFSVARCLCQLHRRDSLFVWQADSHQPPWLAKQQLREPTQAPSHCQVEGRLPGAVLWR